MTQVLKRFDLFRLTRGTLQNCYQIEGNFAQTQSTKSGFAKKV